MRCKADNVPITPLTTAEQAALLRFVNAGGSAVIFTDNENYMTASNSLVGPFGLYSTGVLFFDIPARVTDPLAHPVTDGPFGLVSTFTTFFPGWFDSVGPVAQPLARLDPVDQVALAVIDPGTLSPTSGAVAFFSDSSMLENPRFTGSNRSVVLNAVEFGKLTVVPEPATWVLFGLGLLLLAGYSWGSGRRNLVGKPQ